MKLIVKDLQAPSLRKSPRKKGQIGRERPHFFGFQPPKKFLGSLPPTRSLERKARCCSLQSNGNCSKTRTLLRCGRVGLANCVNGSRRRFGPTQVPEGADPV